MGRVGLFMCIATVLDNLWYYENICRTEYHEEQCFVGEAIMFALPLHI